MEEVKKWLWQPGNDTIRASNMNQYTAWLKKEKGLSFTGYAELWEWSVEHIEDFWESIWQYFNVIGHTPYQYILKTGEEPVFKANWFDGATLNYAEHIFRNRESVETAIVYQSETDPITYIKWGELQEKVARLAHHLRAKGLRPGDRVASFLPNIPEALIAFLAANSLGLVWSSCSPDFGAPSVLDRFQQIHPRVLFLVDAYSYGGKIFDKTSANKIIVDGLPDLIEIIQIPFIHKNFQAESNSRFVSWELAIGEYSPLLFTPVDFDHPIWIMYSSGTTGKPKAITHGTGGILLEHLKAMSLHQDVKEGDRFFWYSTTGWMMWNYANAALLCGATVAIYEGSSAWPDLSVLWNYAREARLTQFGAGASFYLACIKQGLTASNFSGLDQLRSIGYTGSPLPAEGWEWIYNTIKKDIWLISLSGGTDVCSGFVGGNPFDPVYAGETQCRLLGCKLEAYNAFGESVIDEVGEMVITQPLPSMPLYFWNDPADRKYHASYFEEFPGVWRHGDWVSISSRGSITIYGRSDATLNRGGVRIGTSEIYSAVERIPEVLDSLVLSIEKAAGEYYMPLFVVLAAGTKLTGELKQKINTQLRTLYSPRHIPDEIIQSPEVPYTISGKKMETPIKKLIMGKKITDILSPDAMKNPSCIDFYQQWALENQ